MIKPEEERRRQEELRLQQQQNNNELTNLSKKSVTNVSHTHHTHYNFKDTESDTGMLYPSLTEIIHQLFFLYVNNDCYKILYGMRSETCNNIPIMQCFSGISRSSNLKACMPSQTEYA